MTKKNIIMALILAVFTVIFGMSAVWADTILFEDNFNSENSGNGSLNYTEFAKWNVENGSVDLIGNDFSDYYPGNGLYVELDGTSDDAGDLVSKTAFNLNSVTYELKFDLGGSRRGDTNTVTVSLGSAYSESFTFESERQLSTIIRYITIITPSTANLRFSHEGGDNVGLILDNVRLSLVEGAVNSDWIINPSNKHSYKVIDCGNDWKVCENQAVVQGAHLVTINDAAEQQWLVDIFGGNIIFAIGLTDEAEEGNWKWVSGEPVTYTNWSAGEPNNEYGSENYALMNMPYSGQWNDGVGDNPHEKAIIEKSNSSTVDLNYGLVAYYPFNGNANDESGNGNHGTVYDATLAADLFGNPDSAYSFDGVNDYIQIKDSNSLDIGYSDYTIAAWIKTGSTNNGRIFSKGSSGCLTGYMLRIQGENAFLENSYNGCKVSLIGKKIINDNQWHLIVGIVDRDSGAKIYVDGQSDSNLSIDTSKDDLSNSRNPMIGYNDVGNVYEPFNGMIDDIRIYNRILSEAEIQTLYNQGNNPQNLFASFTANRFVGNAPLEVQFTDQSSGNPAAWKWNFGDGKPDSSEQNPTHIFETPGTYTVSLTVSNGTNQDIEIKTAYITVNSSIPETSYYGEVQTVTPENSDGSSNIQITGRAVDRATNSPLPNVPLNIIVSLNGFERTYKAYTDSTGAFHTTFFPLANEYGTYGVCAVHPDSTGKTVQKQFTIRKVLVNPKDINLNIPRNYEQKIDVNVEAGGLDLHNLKLTYDSLPNGVYVTTASPVTLLASGQTAPLTCTIWADNTATDTGKIVLNVKSDENSWGTVTIAALFSEAKPILVYTPDHIETGLALDKVVTETLVLENKGQVSLSDVKISVVKQDGTAKPHWVILNVNENQDPIVVGEKREISISFSPNSVAKTDAPAVSEGMYQFYLQVSSSNYPVTKILLVVSVTQSGIGNVKFKVEDIYTGTTDTNTNQLIEGVKDAKIKLQLISTDGTVLKEYEQITDIKGGTKFENLPTGRYKYRASKENHQEMIGTVWIKPGSTIEEKVFLAYNLVTVEWEVTEITIQDKYEIVLNATYETDVPAPVVVAEPASISLPEMNPGDVITGEIRYTNYGLIRADDLKFTFPQTDEYFKYEILTDSLPSSLQAKEVFTLPYRITCLKSLTAMKRRSDSCYCYSNKFETVYVWVCANGKWSNAGINIPIIECYGQCGGSAGIASYYTESGGGSGSESVYIPPSVAISGLLCPPENPCPDDDSCCWADKMEQANSQINLFNGEYRDDVTDLSVKVPGHLLDVKRSYYDNAWHFNDLKENLEIFYEADGITPKYIKKHGVSYKKADETGTVYSYDETRRILRQEDGYRWEDGSGNWKLYDLKGRIISYGNRNNQKISFIYDANGKLTGLSDNSGKQILWYEYTGDEISAVHDEKGRKVQYFYESGRLSKVIDLLNHEWLYFYDTNGRLESKQNPEGHISKIIYNDFGYVQQIQYPDGTTKDFEYAQDSGKKEYSATVKYSTGRIKEVTYNSKGKKILEKINGNVVEEVIYEGRNERIIDANGYETYREYDEWRNLKRETYPDGSSVSYQYESKFNNRLRTTDERGVVTKYEYDDAGNMTKKIEAYQTPDERVTEYTYENGNLKTEKVVSDVRTAESLTIMEYDENGNLKSVTDPEGNVTGYTYNVMGQVETRTDPGGKIWRYSYDDMGNLKSVADPMGNKTEYEYDNVGNKIKETDSEGNYVAYEYDYAGRVKKIFDMSGKYTEFEYDADGNLKERTDQEGKKIAQEYDLDGRLRKTTDGSGNVIAYEYQNTNGAGCQTCSGGTGSNQPSKIVYLTFSKEFGYDKRGRKETEKDVLNEAESYLAKFGYDLSGNLASETDKENHITAYEYDKLGRKTKTADSLNKETYYTYDDRNNLISLKDAEGNITWFEYDRNNRLTKEIRPMGETTVYEYDKAGNLVKKIDAENQKTEYDYDDAGRMVQIRYYTASANTAPDKTVDFTYYPSGMLKTYNDGVTSAEYKYDSLHRKISETVNYGAFKLMYSYTYYANGLKKSFTGSDNIAYEYTYNASNQLTGISASGTGTLITYDSYNWNRPSQITLKGGVKKEYGYDPLMRIKTISVKNPSQTAIMNYQYSYDKMNNILTKDTEHGKYAFGYDELYRLKTADNAVLTDEAYTYDAVGNRKTDSQVAGDWIYNSNNELGSYDGYVLEYDDNGNMIKKSGSGVSFLYEYDVENRLKRVKKGDGSLIAEYYYDPFGRRLWKEVSGVKTYFFYADEGLTGEYDATGKETKTYGYKPNSIWTTDPVFMKLGSEYYFYHNDHLGTPVQMTDGSGNVAWSAKYDSFGNVEIGVETVVNNLRFPGQYFDGETGLYYNWNRYYDAGVGRYLISDPIGLRQGKNHLYVYVLNNPSKNIDPYGLCTWKGVLNLQAIGDGLGGGYGFLVIESACCNGKEAKGGYIIVYGGLMVGPIPFQIIVQEVELEGPDIPSAEDPTGRFEYVALGGSFGIGYGYSWMKSGNLTSDIRWEHGKGLNKYYGIDCGLEVTGGYAIKFAEGESKCCKNL